ATMIFAICLASTAPRAVRWFLETFLAMAFGGGGGRGPRRLLDLAVQRVLAERRVVLLELEAAGGVPAVLRRRVARRAGRLGALEGHLVTDVLAFGHRSAGLRGEGR